MLTRSPFARLEVKPGEEDEVAAFLMQNAAALLASPPAIERIEVLSAKVAQP